MKDEYGRVLLTPRPLPHQTPEAEAAIKDHIRMIREIRPKSPVDSPEFVVAWLREVLNEARAYDVPTLIRWVREYDLETEAR